MGSETYYVGAFDWRNYEYTKKPLEFNNTEAGFPGVQGMDEKSCGKVRQDRRDSWHGADRPLLVRIREVPTGQRDETGACQPHHVKKSKELDDNDINKNDRKDPKTIVALVNEERFSYTYIPVGSYAEIRSLLKPVFLYAGRTRKGQEPPCEMVLHLRPEYKDVYENLKIVSGKMVLKAALLSEDIIKLRWKVRIGFRGMRS